MTDVCRSHGTPLHRGRCSRCLADDFERVAEEFARIANDRIANCHEVVACPKCHAPIGERCRRARAQYTRRGVFATAEPVLKHPHRERWTQVQPDR